MFNLGRSISILDSDAVVNCETKVKLIYNQNCIIYDDDLIKCVRDETGGNDYIQRGQTWLIS